MKPPKRRPHALVPNLISNVTMDTSETLTEIVRMILISILEKPIFVLMKLKMKLLPRDTKKFQEILAMIAICRIEVRFYKYFTIYYNSRAILNKFNFLI